MADLLATSNQLRARLEMGDNAALERLTGAFTASYETGVEPQINALREWLESHPDATRQQIERSAAYKNLMAAVAEELDDYEAVIKSEVRQIAPAAAREGLTGGALLLATALAVYLGVEVDELPADALENVSPDALDFLAGYLAPEGALFAKINSLSGYNADKIAAGILERVGLGKNPRDIADWITDAYGMGLTDALRTARTVQLYSYRQAENAQYLANADVLEGVVWSAELDDDRVCMSCVSLHGQVFPLGTIANDHHNGRCAMIPLVKGADNPIEQSGRDWFSELPESQQRDMMGASKWEAWREGRFDFADLTKVHDDDVYGEMRAEASLKDLVGDK